MHQRRVQPVLQSAQGLSGRKLGHPLSASRQKPMKFSGCRPGNAHKQSRMRAQGSPDRGLQEQNNLCQQRHAAPSSSSHSERKVFTVPTHAAANMKPPARDNRNTKHAILMRPQWRWSAGRHVAEPTQRSRQATAGSANQGLGLGLQQQRPLSRGSLQVVFTLSFRGEDVGDACAKHQSVPLQGAKVKSGGGSQKAARMLRFQADIVAIAAGEPEKQCTR